MAGPTKKSKRPEEPQKAEVPKEIIVDFEGRNPEEQDFGGIKLLLGQLFLNAHIDLSQMTDLIIAQNGLGCTLKQAYDDDSEEDEDDSVYGITTVINLKGQRETPCVQQFFSLLQELSEKHADPDNQTKLTQITNKNENIGYLVNERFTNIPTVASVSMLNSLSTDITRIKKKNPTYDFTYYIMIVKTWKHKDNANEVIFSNEEEAYFCEDSIVNFDFMVGNESDTGVEGKQSSDELVPYRKIIIFEANKLISIVNKITADVQA